jgi:hypothetical protein
LVQLARVERAGCARKQESRQAGEPGRLPLPVADELTHDDKMSTDRRPPPADPTPAPGPEVLTRTESLSLVGKAGIGRLGFVVDGWPVILPVNYAIDGDGVVVRAAPGAKLTAARSGCQVAIEVDSIDELYRSGWSVLIHGIAEEVTDAGEVSRLDRLPLHPWARGSRRAWIRVRPVQITGRRLARSWQYPGPVTG